MTLRELNTLFREAELIEGEEPLVRLVCIIGVLRSLRRGEAATDEGIDASVESFKRHYGPISTDAVDVFMNMEPEVIDVDIPDDYLLEILGAE